MADDKDRLICLGCNRERKREECVVEAGELTCNNCGGVVIKKLKQAV